MDCFTPDYAYLPNSIEPNRTVSNPGELLRSDAFIGVLRLCGIPEREIDRSSSDFELFRAFCKAFPMLTGHPTHDVFALFWNRRFPTFPLPNEANAATLWKDSTTILTQESTRLRDFFPATARVLADPSKLESLTNEWEPMLFVNTLLQHDFADFDTLESDAQSCFEAFFKKGCRQLLISLDSAYGFVRPDPYHVSVALQSKGKERQSRSIILSQLFRKASAFALQNGMQILLLADCDASSARELLAYTERAVGLPTLYWASKSSAVTDVILHWQTLPHQNPVYMTLRLSDLPSREECASAIRSAAARYPIGRICMVTESPLLLLTQAQERMREILTDTVKKL